MTKDALQRTTVSIKLWFAPLILAACAKLSPSPEPSLDASSGNDAGTAAADSGVAADAGIDGGPSVDSGADAGTPPEAPTSLTATPGNHRISLSWAAASGATGYIVYRSLGDAGAVVDAGSSTTTTYSDTNLPNGATYLYYVKGVSPYGTEGTASSSVSATPFQEICVVNSNEARNITVHDSLQDGGAPLRRFGWMTEILYPAALAVAPTNYEVHVASWGSNSIVTHRADAGGNASPARVVKGTNTETTKPTAMAFDSTTGEIMLLVAGDPPYMGAPVPATILVFSSSANGNQAYTRKIAGNLTELEDATGIAVNTVAAEIVVAQKSQISVFARSANGNVAPIRKITNVLYPTDVAVDGTNNEIVLAYSASIRVYVGPDGGALAPERIIQGGSSGLSVIKSVAVDPMNNEILALENSTKSIRVFDRLADGGAAPLRTIEGNQVGLTDTTRFAVDVPNNLIFVAESAPSAVRVFPRAGNGNIAPLWSLTGASTGLTNPTSVVADTTNNELYVSDYSSKSIVVYQRTADGTVTPSRTISGIATAPFQMALDLTNNELLVAAANAIYVYSRTASGAATPTRTITSSSALMAGARGIALDSVNGELFVTDVTWNAIWVFARTATGDVAPLRSIKGAATQLSLPWELAIDPVNNEIVVANGVNRINTYARTAEGNVAPTRTISGASTGLSSSFSVAVDPISNEIVVSSSGTNDLRIFSRTANGDVAPIRTIGGSATRITSPTSVAICN